MNLQKHMSALLKKNSSDEAPASDDAPQESAPSSLGPDQTQTPAPSPASAPLSAPNSASDILTQCLRQNEHIGISICSHDGTLLEVSPAYARIVGLSPDDMAGVRTQSDLVKRIADNIDFVDSDTDTRVKEILLQTKQQMAKKTDFHTEWLSQTLGGRILRFRSQYTTSGAMLSMVTDVTEQEERAHLITLGMEIGTSGYWAFNYATGKTDFSAYIEEKLTDDELDLVRKNSLLALVHPEDLEAATLAFMNCRSHNERLDGTYRINTARHGTLWVRIIGEFQKIGNNQDQGRFLAFINDVTEDKKHQKMLMDAQELSKAKSEFLARMSHEIKTPLNAIVGMTEALQDEVTSDEARETVRYIAEAADSLNHVLSHTLEHARLSSREITLDVFETDPKELIRSTASLFKKSMTDKGLAFGLRIADTVPDTIQTDATRLRQCVTNFLSNAVKFTSEGRVDVAMAVSDAGKDGPRLIVAVKDTGIGMSDEAASRVFQPFAQADETINRRFGGSGLGMAITQQIVDAMGGDIRVKSAVGVGTTMMMSIPLNLAKATDMPATAPLQATPADAAAQDAAPAPVSASVVSDPAPTSARPSPAVVPAQSGVTQPESTSLARVEKNVSIQPKDYSGFDVLVVEDNPINQKVVGKLLSNHVRSVSFAFNGEEGLKMLHNQGFDVILMDIHMPVKDGIETTLEIRASGQPWADIVIVALTADPDYQQKRICRNIGMNDTIAKPVRRKDLLDAMERVLSEREKKQNKVA